MAHDSHDLRTAPARRRGRLLAIGAAALIGIGTIATPGTAAAQGRARSAQGIPPGHLPPPGECRVWYDGRPPGQQPSPTGCGAARRLAARTGGRVIYRSAERRDVRSGRDCDAKDRAKGECGWDGRDRGDRDRDRTRDRDRNRDRSPDRNYPVVRRNPL